MASAAKWASRHARSVEIFMRDPSDGVYSTDGDWVHAVEVRVAQRTLYVSGTMGLDVQGAPAASLDDQLQLI